MEPNERQEMLASLVSSRQALVDAVGGVTEELAARRPAAERWSILECIEHVAVAEDYLLGQIAIAVSGEPIVNRKREEAIRARAADRSRPVAAPKEAVPGGRYGTLAAALQHFLECRAGTIQFVEGCSADLRAQATTHPIIGAVNCWETLLMMAAHPRRHAGQIVEIRAALEE